MTKAEREILKRGFNAINRQLTALNKADMMIYKELKQEIANLFLALQETQAQQRRSSETMKKAPKCLPTTTKNSKT